MATVKAKPNFDPEAECQILRNAMKGIGTDDDAIIEVIGSCNNAQRQQLRFHFAQMFGKVLMEDFKSELSGNLRKLVKAIMYSQPMYDAQGLRKAMRGLGTDENCLIQILTTKTNQEMAAIKEEYTFEIKRDLQDDLQSETSGPFKRLLYSLSTGIREESEDVNVSVATADAAELVEAGIQSIGTDESTFNRILCSQSHSQLRQVFAQYKRMTGESIITSVKKEFSGNLRDGLVAIAQIVINPATYFAQQLRASMKGLGTDDFTLMRIIVSRSEIDLEHIKSEFFTRYGKSLTSWIADDTSGDYRKLMMKILGDETTGTTKRWEDDELWSSDED